MTFNSVFYRVPCNFTQFMYTYFNICDIIFLIFYVLKKSFNNKRTLNLCNCTQMPAPHRTFINYKSNHKEINVTRFWTETKRPLFIFYFILYFRCSYFYCTNAVRTWYDLKNKSFITIGRYMVIYFFTYLPTLNLSVYIIIEYGLKSSRRL